ncbi:hypothetical protein B0H10DRAFT_287302 [Mycena sp. CBHHK59/15]|nr:hypothetical protein B0H10DRAFT_287302 [Mycena sp. CBHHK59/15]
MKAMASLRVCLDVNVSEILRDVGPEGLHVAQITESSGTRVDSDKLARLMRFLANPYIFRHVKPDVFAHTMSSSVLDTRKSLNEIMENPAMKHDGTLGIAVLVEYLVDDVAKASTVLLHNMTDPKTAFSDSPIHTPFQRVFKHDLPIYNWYDLPAQAYRRLRFGSAMTGLAAVKDELVLGEFAWDALPKGTVVVGVGGGFGTSGEIHCGPCTSCASYRTRLARDGRSGDTGSRLDPR